MKFIAGAAIACIGVAVIVRHARGPAAQRPVGLLRGALYILFAVLVGVGSDLPTWLAGVVIALLLATALALVVLGLKQVSAKVRS